MKTIGNLRKAESANNKTTFTIEVPGDFIPVLERQQTKNLEIIIPDPRKISSEQRKKHMRPLMI